jgi:hypothetical protein
MSDIMGSVQHCIAYCAVDAWGHRLQGFLGSVEEGETEVPEFLMNGKT